MIILRLWFVSVVDTADQEIDLFTFDIGFITFEELLKIHHKLGYELFSVYKEMKPQGAV